PPPGSVPGPGQSSAHEPDPHRRRLPRPRRSHPAAGDPRALRAGSLDGDRPRRRPAGDTTGRHQTPERARRRRTGHRHTAWAREALPALPAPAHRRGLLDGRPRRALGRAPGRATGPRRRGPAPTVIRRTDQGVKRYDSPTTLTRPSPKHRPQVVRWLAAPRRSPHLDPPATARYTLTHAHGPLARERARLHPAM